jgi:hypothetical protein
MAGLEVSSSVGSLEVLNMRTKLLVVIAIIAVSIALGKIFIYRWESTNPVASNQVSTLLSMRPLSAAVKPKKTNKSAVIAPDWFSLSQQLNNGSPGKQAEIIKQLSDLGKQSPYALAIGLKEWMPGVMNLQRYGDAERLAQIAILGKPQDVAIVEVAQRARVEAFIAQGDIAHAVVEVKSLYNVIELSKTQEAVDLFAKATGQHDTANLEAAIHATAVHVVAYNVKIKKLAAQKATGGMGFTQTLALGNLLLLADRPADARKCFESACKLANSQDSDWLPDAVQGLARSIRAQYGSVEQANAMILALRQKQPSADESQLGDARLIGFAAGTVTLARAGEPSLPAAEIRRQQMEDQIPSGAVRIETGFECSTPLEVRQLSPTHFQILLETPGFRDWFLFRVMGAAGKTVRFDLQDPDGNVGKWRTLNPVYACVDRLDTPSAFIFDETRHPTTRSTGFNGALLPETQDQTWHYMEDAWATDVKTLNFTQQFEGNVAYVAMRIPYTPSYNAAYLRNLADKKKIKLVEIGRSSLNKPLLMAEIGGDDRPAGVKPCVLAYSCEHADEPDSGWAAHGMIDFLTGDSSSAKELCNRFTFLIIPMFDPDTAILGEHERIMTSFRVNHFSTESVAYANWFEQWIDAGNRLDVVLDLHNVQSVEDPHIFSPMIEGGIADRAKLIMAMHLKIMAALENAGYTVSPRPRLRGVTPDRLGGWLAVRYGPVFMAYELNSQSPDRHLSLAELTAVGGIFAQGIDGFWESKGHALIANIDSIRQARLNRWAKAPPTTQPANAIEAEAWRSASAMGGRDISAGELIAP